MLDCVIDSVLIRKHSQWTAQKFLGFFCLSEVGVIVIRQTAVNWATARDRSDLCSI